MTRHVKPSAEELLANAQKALENDEKIKVETDPTKKEEVVVPSKEPNDPTPTPSPEPPKETPEKELVEDPPKKPEGEEPPDYKKKFVNSSVEAKLVYSQNKKLAEALDKAGNIPEPTDEEMLTEYPEWEDMTAGEKKLAKKSVINERRFSAIGEVTKEFKDFDDWSNKVDSILADPKTAKDYPDLVGKEEDFKLFTMKPTRINADMDLLVAGFLRVHNEAKPKNKGSMFETGSGGPSTKVQPKSDKITPAQAKVLRETDYKKYKQYLDAGKIDFGSLT